MFTAQPGQQIFISFVGDTGLNVDADDPSFSFIVDLVTFPFATPKSMGVVESTAVGT